MTVGCQTRTAHPQRSADPGVSRTGLPWYSTVWNGLDSVGLSWIGLDWIGLNWIELVWTSQPAVGAQTLPQGRGTESLGIDGGPPQVGERDELERDHLPVLAQARQLAAPLGQRAGGDAVAVGEQLDVLVASCSSR